MSKFAGLIKHPGISGAIVMLALGAVLLAFSLNAMAQFEGYQGPEFCKWCHEENYNQWRTSGHPYKLMKGSNAQFRPIPLPEGFSWDDISYVIGGYKWKSRYMDERGYIITQTGEERDVPGMNQYNLLTGEWVDYNADEIDKPYNCGACHTTVWIPDEDAETDGDLSDNQDGLEGIHGIFYAGGIQCEECHGPGFASMEIDPSAEACGKCHSRGDPNTVPASGGFIRHHEQYNELLAGAHASRDCVMCHNPHLPSELSIKENAVCGESCHRSRLESYSKTSMYDYGVTCEDCHMPYATKSAQALGPEVDGRQTMGDLRTHIFYIDTDPDADMFTEDGSRVQLDSRGRAAVTMNFACQRCHVTASLDELALFAKDFHDTDKGLEDIGLDPGLTGTWWNEAKDGEGFLLEVAYAGGQLFLYASFYTYGPDGEQTWLVAALTSQDGIRANVTVYAPQGGEWGNPGGADTSVEFGTGYFEFPTCESGSFMFTPNGTFAGMGYTAQGYDLVRTLESGISCPTFVNNEMAALR